MKEYQRKFLQLISNKPVANDLPEAKYYSENLICVPEEAVHIYSIEHKRLIFAKGWKDLLGYDDDKVTAHDILNATTEEFSEFSGEFIFKIMMFLASRTNDLEKYRFTLALKKYHKDGHAVPLVNRICVLKQRKGRVLEIYSRMQRNPYIKFGKVHKWAGYGPEIEELEDILNKELFQNMAISKKERDALSLVARGFSFKQIAAHFNISLSAVEKRMIPLYKRFNVKSLPQLISYAYENHLLP